MFDVFSLLANVAIISLFAIYMKDNHRLDRDTREAERALRLPLRERLRLRMARLRERNR